ncbi:MAG TPA: DUF58 domain-containing protein [Microscillaceae bacterium]|nr:DUF58 domain-containing protein [Microscillaceae bacterium]
MTKNADIQSLLKPEVLNTVEGLALLSRLVIGALPSGLNRSVRNGQGMEFKQYRSYQPGDDLRLLDWKMYARSDRFYVKEAEVETHILVKFVLDASASMRHQDNNGLEKIAFARAIIAALAYLAVSQGDHIGLYAINDREVRQVAPQTGTFHLHRFLYELLQIQPTGQWQSTRSGQRHTMLGEQKHYKEMVICLSDLYEENGEIFDLLKNITARKNEVMVFHLMAQNELDLSYPAGVFSFQDLETQAVVQVNPTAVRATYQANVAAYLAAIQQQALDLEMSYALFKMHEPLQDALTKFLLGRQRIL